MYFTDRVKRLIAELLGIEDGSKKLLLSQIFGHPPHYSFSPSRVRDVFAFYSRLRPQPTQHSLVRLGSANDGGYVLPALNFDGAYLYSGGISDNCDFEQELADQGMSVFMLDGSIESAPQEHPRFVFESKFLSRCSSGEKYLSLLDWC